MNINKVSMDVLREIINSKCILQGIMPVEEEDNNMLDVAVDTSEGDYGKLLKSLEDKGYVTISGEELDDDLMSFRMTERGWKESTKILLFESIVKTLTKNHLLVTDVAWEKRGVLICVEGVIPNSLTNDLENSIMTILSSTQICIEKGYKRILIEEG